ADHLGLYGYSQPTSPTIDALAAESTVFDRAVPTCPSTAPSVASLLTGHYRAAHGVRRNGATMPAAVETLAEMLKARGYQRAARVANPLLDSQYGFNQGFDYFGMPPDIGGRSPAILEGLPLVRDAEWLIDQLAGRRFFLWLHFHDPHGPYFPPDDYQA